MMARRRNKHLQPVRPLNTARYPTRVATRNGSFLVREIPADKATKAYVCPGCQNPIKPGVAHVVAWQEEPAMGSVSGIDARRHWHNHCWRLQR